MPRPLSKWNGFVRTATVNDALAGFAKALQGGTATTCSVALTPRALRMIDAFVTTLKANKTTDQALEAAARANTSKRR